MDNIADGGKGCPFVVILFQVQWWTRHFMGKFCTWMNWKRGEKHAHAHHESSVHFSWRIRDSPKMYNRFSCMKIVPKRLTRCIRTSSTKLSQISSEIYHVMNVSSKDLSQMMSSYTFTDGRTSIRTRKNQTFWFICIS